MQKFKDLEQAYKKALALVGKEITRIIIHPMFAVYNGKEYDHYFLHIDRKGEDDEEKSDMFEFNNTEDLLKKLIAMET